MLTPVRLKASTMPSHVSSDGIYTLVNPSHTAPHASLLEILYESSNAGASITAVSSGTSPKLGVGGNISVKSSISSRVRTRSDATSTVCGVFALTRLRNSGRNAIIYSF